MDPSLNSTPMDLLNAIEDSAPCNLKPMNRALALGVSVGEGCIVEAEIHMETYSLFACTDHRRQVTHRQYIILITMVVEVASDKGHT